MSTSLEMASINKFSYQRLIRNEGYGFDEDEEEEFERQIEKKRSWFKFRRLGSSRRRSKVKIPGLRRFSRRRARFLSSVRVSWCKVMKRLKDSRAHMGDLFAGNYLLMQVNPTSFKSLDNNKYSLANHGIHSFNPKYSTDRPRKIVLN